MQIPVSDNIKKVWVWLATALLVIATVVGLRMVFGERHHGYDNGAMPAVITVSGKGEIKAVPDVSKFMVTVEETAKDQSTALNASSEKVNNVIDLLKKAGIEEKDIKTEYTNVNPKYEYPSGRAEIMIYPPVSANPVIVGYTSSHTLSVKVRDIGKVSDVQQIFAGAKVQNISGPDLSIDDVDGIKIDAREKAIADAKAQAEVLAEQLGVRLGKIVSFSESGNENYPMYMSARADVAMAGKTAPEANIATGEQTITSNVSITYKIR
jgi:uncharacterized protein YggE